MSEQPHGGIELEIKGAPGVGKSTFAAALSAWLEREGHRVKFKTEVEAAEIQGLRDRAGQVPGLGAPGVSREFTVSTSVSVEF